MQKHYYVYILASGHFGTLYIGMTNDLIRRIHEHRTHADPTSFTAQYNATRLVYFETYDDPETAILRERRMKKWERDWKIKLVEQYNPHWNDLYEGLV